METSEMKKPYLLLKWGTIKSWSNMNEHQQGILKRWQEEGVSASAMAHQDTYKQKLIICELIDTMEDGRIQSDWSGEIMTREEAKEYILQY